MTRRIAALMSALALGLGVITAPSAAAYEPRLQTVDCPADTPAPFTCAELIVPLDWATPDDGRTTTIAVMIARAGGSSPQGGFTFNPGGPGGSGLALAPGIYHQLPTSVRDAFDVVAWDPRGVGRSGPQLAPCDAKPPQNLPPTGPVDWAAAWADYGQRLGAALRTCFDANPQAAPYLGTWQVIRDLDALRAAMGYEVWNYWAMSYGTRIGYSYAMTFPGRLGRLVSDGNLFTTETLMRLTLSQPDAWYAALQTFASVEGRNLAAKFLAAIAVMDDTTYLSPTSGKVLTRWEVADSVYMGLSSQLAYPPMKAFINGLYDTLVAHGSSALPSRVDRALRRVQSASARSSNDPVTTGYVYNFVNCADLHDRPSADVVAQVAEQVARKYTPTMAMATAVGLDCQGLPADYARATPNGLASIALTPKPLVVNAIGDRATPWAWGRTMANAYAGARMITYNSSQHVSYRFVPSDCLNDAVTTYLLTGRRPRKDLFCDYAPGPPPAAS